MTKIDPKQAVTRILDQRGNVVGAGFVVTDDGLIATCAHVVEAAGAGPGEVVRIVFHATGEERQAYVEPDWWRGSDAEDVAILRLEEPLPEEVEPFPLGSSGGTSGHSFKTFGFPDVSPEEGIWGDGHILEATTLQGVPVLQLRSQEVTPGCSGAPVLDTVTHRVVGMVTAITEPDAHSRLAETAFITPTETMRAACPALQLSDLCPYRGLAAFTEADAEFFFGRERVVERLVESLGQEPRFLAVLGPSGCGKSSLVQAGLIPHLRRGAVPGSDRWGVMVARPADQPFHQLEAQGLTGTREDLGGAVQTWLECHPDQERLVLVLDQFEELLVSTAEDVRLAFLAQLTTLLTATLPITIALVMRDDFYSHFAREATVLLTWLERGLVNVPLTLTRDELQDIVRGPARAVGLTFEAGLVEDILKDALESTAAGERQVGRSTILPLLEFTLTQLWERRQDGVLTHDAYEAIGGVTGGLAQWADRAYYGLGQDQQRLARRVLADLVRLGDESQGLPDSRRRRPLETLYRDEREQEAVHGVVRQLADARLLVSGRNPEGGQETVELIHDALLREWRLLKGWLDEDRRFLAWRQMLEGRLQAWVESSPDDPARRDSGRLLRGRDLVEAERWLTERRDDLWAEEGSFIEVSLARAKRVRRLTAGAVILAFLVVSLLALFAWSQRNQAVHEAGVRATAQAQAEEQRRQAEVAQATAAAEANVRATAQAEAEVERQIALARQLAAQAQSVIVMDNTGTGLVRSVLLAVESLRRFPTLEGNQAVRAGLAMLPRPMAKIAHEADVNTLAFSPDGRWLATGSGDGTVRVCDAATGQELMRMTHEAEVTAVAFSPDGKWLVTRSGQTLRVYEAITFREIAWMTDKGNTNAINFSPDSKWLATAGNGATVRVWETATWQEIAQLMHEGNVNVVAFSPDGKWLASGSAAGSVRVWDVATWQEVARMTHAVEVTALAFRPDGKWLATASMHDNKVWVWDVAAGQELVQLSLRGTVYAVTFSRDGNRLVAVSVGLSEGWVQIWGDTWQEMAEIAHEGGVGSVTFRPDGKRLAIGGTFSESVRVWDTSTGQKVAQIEHIDAVRDVAFSSDGQRMATASGNVAWVLEAEALTGPEMIQISHEADVNSITFSPDGKWVATGSDDGIARIWDAVTGQKVAWMIHDEDVHVVTFSPDGKWLVTGSGPMTEIWEVSTGREVARMAHEYWEYNLAFSHDGRWMAIGGGGGVARVWETAIWREVAQMTHEGDVSAVAFSPDSKWLATGDEDGMARVWETATWREVARMTHDGGVNAVTFSPDSRLLATNIPTDYHSKLGLASLGSDGKSLSMDSPPGQIATSGKVWIWEIATGQEVARIEYKGALAASGGVIFSTNGRWVAIVESTAVLIGPSEVWVWEIVTGRKVARIAPNSYVYAIAFSPDGRWLATASRDGTARVWKAATGEEAARMAHEDEVWAIAFSPDGRYLVTVSRDRKPWIWLWRPEDLTAEACVRLARNLSRAEWERFLPGEPYRRTCPNLPVPEE